MTMHGDNQFEKVWFLCYLFGGVLLISWLFFLSFPMILLRANARYERRQPNAQVTKLPWQAVSLCVFVPILGTVLCGVGALSIVAPYLTRFDREGVTYLGVTGWNHEPWSNVSKVALIPEGNRRILRLYLPYYALDFSSQTFVRPEQVARTLQNEVDRNRKTVALGQSG